MAWHVHYTKLYNMPKGERDKPMKLSHMILNSKVTFFTDIKGTRVIILEAVLDSSNDMPRLYRLAKDQLADMAYVLRAVA